MEQLTLEEVRLRLEEIPAEAFGCAHETCAIGQLHRIITNGTSFGFDSNVYPPDVARVVAEWNDNMLPEKRKIIAMMMPLPESFPMLTKERAKKLALWVSEKALSFYDGPKRAVLERAVALARRAAAGEPFTEEDVWMTLEAVNKVYRSAARGQQSRVNGLIFNMTRFLVNLMLGGSWGAFVVETLCGMARVARHAGIEWREWLEEYLRVRLEA